MIKAVIFDMDGIIVDSEPLHSRAFTEILKNYGHEPELNEHGLVHNAGLLTEDNWELLKKKHLIDEDTKTLVDKKRNRFLEILKEDIKPMPGLMELIQIVKAHKLKLAVASNSKMEVVETILERLGIKEKFDFIIARDFLENTKPHPEIYIKAAAELGIDPEFCLAIEDSQTGIEAAFNAGMKIIAVPTSRNKDEVFLKAMLIVSSLEDITWDILTTI